jgi:NaMN:DMB phosphoribosyltransferase
MPWAVERIVLGPDGRPARRIESERERRQRELQAAIEAGTAENKRSDDPLHYRIIERPPESWLRSCR